MHTDVAKLATHDVALDTAIFSCLAGQLARSIHVALAHSAMHNMPPCGLEGYEART
jgi:hypothetical protein